MIKMFIYLLKERLRNRMFIFWSLLFPLALMTCFKVAFGNLTEDMDIDTKNVAVIHSGDNKVYSDNFDCLIDDLTKDGTNKDKALFVKHDYENEEEVMKALSDGELDIAYKVYDDKIETLLPAVHSETSIAVGKAVADEYMNNSRIIQSAYEINSDRAMELIDDIGKDIDYVEPKKSDFIDDSPNPYIWYFYSTLIMGILFNSMNGIDMVSNLKADAGYHAMRVSVSPMKKSKLILTSYAVYLTITMTLNLIQLVVMNKIFDVPLGNSYLKLFLFILSCNIFALALGTSMGCLLKGPVKTRGNKTTAIIMISSFLSGEMIEALPGAIEMNIPIINDINPATVMNMAFFRLAYSTENFDFYINLIKIVVMAAICLTISIMSLRREKYASV